MAGVGGGQSIVDLPVSSDGKIIVTENTGFHSPELENLYRRHIPEIKSTESKDFLDPSKLNLVKIEQKDSVNRKDLISSHYTQM